MRMDWREEEEDRILLNQTLEALNGIATSFLVCDKKFYSYEVLKKSNEKETSLLVSTFLEV